MNQKKIDARMMERARHEAKYATCDADQVGCVIAAGDLVLSTGYNGAPRGVPHCTDAGCVIQFAESLIIQAEITVGEVTRRGRYTGGREYSRHVHAEANAICAAAYYGRMLKGATCYVTCPPCPDCSKLLLQAGIARVVFEATDDQTEKFANGASYELFYRGGMTCERILDTPKT